MTGEGNIPNSPTLPHFRQSFWPNALHLTLKLIAAPLAWMVMRQIRSLLAIAIAALAGTLPAGFGPAGESPPPAPNFLVDVSAHLIDKVVGQKIDRIEPYEDAIQNIPVTGTRRTVGAVRPELVPDASRAHVELVLSATNCSRDVGAGPCVWIHTTSMVPFEIRQPVVLDTQGFRICPGPARVQVNVNLLGIVTDSGETDTFITRLARFNFDMSRKDGEAEVAYKTARQATCRLREELAPTLSAGNEYYAHGLDLIKKSGLTLEHLQFSTTAAFLQVRARIATPAGPRPQAPQELPENAAFGLRIHQSMLNQLHTALLGGKTFTPAELRRRAQSMSGILFRDPRPKQEQLESARLVDKFLTSGDLKSVTVTLPERDPVHVAFAAQSFTTTLHISKVHQDGKVYSGTKIAGDYKVVNTREGVEVIRQGDPRILPADGAGKLDPLPPSLAVPMAVLAGAILQERLVLADPPLPPGVSRLGNFIPQASTGNGWALLSWKLKD